MIDPETWSELLQEAECAISVYLPVDPAERDLRAHEARLRRLIDTAEERLGSVNGGTNPGPLQKLREFAAGIDFAEHRAPGLAIFARNGPGAEASVHRIELPEMPPEVVVTGPDFHIKPLLKLRAANRRFWVLALSRGDVRLFSATPFSWQEVPLEALPLEVQAELDSRPAANAGTLEATRRELLVAEPRRIGFALNAVIGDDDAPLVLAADPNVAGHFAQQVELRQMLDSQLHLNPFGIPESELHAKAVELVRPLLDAELETVLNQINARLGTAEPTVAIRLEEILQAAREGRVDAVVVAEDETLWGRYGEDTIIAHGTPRPEDEDLLNLAAVLTLRTGGRAFAVPRDGLPRQVPAAASLRF